MKLRNLSFVLFFAACGGGKDTPPTIVDTPPAGDGGGTFPNSLNDMVYFTPTAEVETAFTPQNDSPDNATAVSIGATGASRFTGEMGIAGDRADEYLERDTFLIATGATTNQLTIRLDADSTTADLDFALFAEPAAGDTDVLSFGSGTLISDETAEFQTFAVDPNRNYWLWSGVYNVLEEGGTPTLPVQYDLSVYGENITEAVSGTCNFTEAADNTNDILSEGAPAGNVEEPSGQQVTTGSHVYCGKIDEDHFVVDAADPTFGVVDIDAFSLSINLEQGVDLGLPVKITLTGATAADTALLAGLLQVEWQVLNNVVIDGEPVHQFFGGSRGFFTNTHGVLTTTLILSSTVDDTAGSTTMGQVVGPKSISIIAFNGADIPADINYKLKIEADQRDVRAPRTSGAADAAEANDNP
jgi:hypothetical protein